MSWKTEPHFGSFWDPFGHRNGNKKIHRNGNPKKVNSKTGQTKIWCRFGSIWGPYFATKNDHDVEAKMSSKKGGSKGDPGVVRGPGVIYI